MTEERIINRIRKMLALANDLAATEHERDTALSMAHKLLAKYNLDLEAIKDKPKEPRIDFSSPCYGEPWVRQVSAAIADLFFCRYYYGARVTPTQIEHHFVGKESNAVTAAVMADWIARSIMREGVKLYRQVRCAQHRSFATGAAYRLRERIEEMKAQPMETKASDGKALVLADVYGTELRANDKFLEESGVRLKSKKRRASSVNSGAFERGREFGNTINLNRQVGQQAKSMLR